MASTSQVSRHVSIQSLTTAQLLSGQALKMLAKQKFVSLKEKVATQAAAVEHEGQAISASDGLKTILTKIYQD